MPDIHYSAQSTATTYLCNRKPLTYLESKLALIQNPCATTRAHTSQCAEHASPGMNRGLRKSVKFDRQTAENRSQLLEPWAVDIKQSAVTEIGADTMPLIELGTDPAKQVTE